MDETIEMQQSQITIRLVFMIIEIDFRKNFQNLFLKSLYCLNYWEISSLFFTELKFLSHFGKKSTTFV